MIAILGVLIAMQVVLSRLLRIDLGFARFTLSSVCPIMAGLWFGPVPGAVCGLTADIQNLRRQGRQMLGSQTLAFIYSLLLMVFHRHDYKMRLNIDYEITERHVMTVCVGNALGYGQTPNAVPYSGMLDVSVVYNPKVKQLLAGLWLLVTGRLLNHKSVHPYRIRKMSAESDKALICVDGRPAERVVGEYHLHVEPEMINFLIPD